MASLGRACGGRTQTPSTLPTAPFSTVRPSADATPSMKPSYCPRPSTPSLMPLTAFVAARAAAAIGASPGSRGWTTTESGDLELLGALGIVTFSLNEPPTAYFGG